MQAAGGGWYVLEVSWALVAYEPDILMCKCLPDASFHIVDIYEISLHHVELLQAVGMLRVCNISDMIKDFYGIYWFPLAFIWDNYSRLRWFRVCADTDILAPW